MGEIERILREDGLTHLLRKINRACMNRANDPAKFGIETENADGWEEAAQWLDSLADNVSEHLIL